MDIADQWFRLDNAAKLYPAIEDRNRPSVFRISVTLRSEVKPEILKQAAEAVLPRFPSFQVRLVTGVFWYYFERNTRDIQIEPDGPPYCRRILHADADKYMFRIRYAERTIALEVFHAVTDGTGAMIFLKTVTAQYLRLAFPDIDIPAGEGVLDLQEPPKQEELEDSFSRHYGSHPRRPKAEPKVYHVRGTGADHGQLKLTIGSMPISQVLQVCRSKQVTVTEYLSAVYLFSLYQLQRREGGRQRSVRLSVPVNLRRMYASQTLRNFTLFIKPGIDPYLGSYTFDEVLHQVHHYMRYELNDKYLREEFSANVYMERQPLLRVMPVVVKNWMISYVFNHYGENYYSGTLSNLGKVIIPEAMQQHVEQFHFVLGANRINKNNATALSYGDTLVYTFARTIEETDLEQLFFSFLVEQGIPVSVAAR